MRSLLRSLSCSILAASTLATAQQGDQKDQAMIDPIPADKIPPSPYLDDKAAIKSFELPDGYVIETVATGEHVHLAVAVSFDANGRAWTAEMRSYMPDLDGTGEDTPNGRIRVLEDTDADGKMDKVTTFLEGLVLPRAVAVTSDGCLYTSGDALYFTKRDGLKPIGDPILVDAAYAAGGNPEHKANGLLYGHDNWYYNAKSDRRYRRINGKWLIEKTDFRGQWGIAKDNVGRLYHNDNSTILRGDSYVPDFFRGNPKYTPHGNPAVQLGSNRVFPIHMTPGINRAYLKDVLDKDGKLINATATCGIHIYRGQNFPKEMQEMAFSCEPGADLIKAIKITRDANNRAVGTHPYGNKEFLASTDEWFLPCNIYTAPDGTMWVVDMYFGILQHKAYMTTYLRKQYASRGLDKPLPNTGRLYRIRYAKNPVGDVPKMEGKSAAEIAQFLFHPNGTIRDTAQRLIVESGDKSVAPILAKLITNKASDPFGQIQAMWTLEGLGISDDQAFASALKSTHLDVQRTALDVLSNLRPKSAAILEALKNVPVSPTTCHSLVRAMAANGLAEDSLKIVSTLTQVPQIRETFISGLGSDAHDFVKNNPEITDAGIKNHLTKAANTKIEVVAVPGAHLKGNDLESFKRGEKLYATTAACFGCHGGDGQGQPSLGPPLSPSEWVTGDPERLAKILLHGMVGPVTVNGKLYKPAADMPRANLTPEQFADVMTYVRNAWTNKASAVSAELVKKVAEATKDRSEAYTEKDLK